MIAIGIVFYIIYNEIKPCVISKTNAKLRMLPDLKRLTRQDSPTLLESLSAVSAVAQAQSRSKAC